MATNGTESTPLIHNAASPKPYYFLAGRRDSIDGESLERLPVGATEEEFASRPVMVGCVQFHLHLLRRKGNI